MSRVDPNFENPYASLANVAAQAPASDRATFIRNTYIHLVAAVYAFAALLYAIFTLAPVDQWMMQFFSIPYAMLIMFGGFIGASWIADRWAHSNTSPTMQYAGLGLYVAAQAIFIVPMLWYAQQFANGANIIATAGVITAVIFGGLTGIVMLTKADFSFLRTGLMLAGIGAFGLILCSAVFGMHLGVWFTVGMVVFAAAYILYDTSNVLHHYRTDQHVAASLALFASVALLFWYVLQLVMSFSGRD